RGWIGPAAMSGSRRGGRLISGGHHRRRGGRAHGWSAVLMKILYTTKYFMSRIQFGGRRTCAVPESAACVRPRGQEQVKTRWAEALGPFRATSNSPKPVTASVSGVSRE